MKHKKLPIFFYILLKLEKKNVKIKKKKNEINYLNKVKYLLEKIISK